MKKLKKNLFCLILDNDYPIFIETNTRDIDLFPLEILDSYKRARHKKRCDMWLKYRNLRSFFDLSDKKIGGTDGFDKRCIG
ncbi:MAG: hypothetical protein DRH90_02175 [Deltaproteobacteria bacterium]|nr:MAG: hypothetical protein DRH90_02175 [Deltaproteobacteria bacterium]